MRVCCVVAGRTKEALESQGYEIISLAQNAQLRMQQGAGSPVSRNGNWTREGVLYVPKKGAFLTRNSPIMQNAKEATQAHRKGRDYLLTDEQVEQSLQDSVQLSGNEIPTNRFGENEITNYAFGDQAEAYGKFLREAGIKEMPVYLANVLDEPFARQMWFGGLGGGSGLGGLSGDLYDDLRLRGVLMGAEGTPQNLQDSATKVEAYTPKQISKALNDLGIGGLEAQIFDKLKR